MLFLDRKADVDGVAMNVSTKDTLKRVGNVSVPTRSQFERMLRQRPLLKS